MYYLVIMPFIIIIYIYKFFISPFIGLNCRFYPSCSDYSINALKIFGFKGILLIFKRIIKCHPFNKGGIDNIPKKKYQSHNKYREH